MRALLVTAVVLTGCNADPGEVDQTVDYRDGDDGGPNSGERGTVRITEVLWSGTVTDEGIWDRDDVFVELRNEGNRPVNLSNWQLELHGSIEKTWLIPASDHVLDVGEHAVIAAKDSGCIPGPAWVISDLFISRGDPFKLTLVDADERLIEPIGSETMPPLAGGYDLVVSRSMERIELMFGGAGTEPSSWHFYTQAEVEVPNNEGVASDCRKFTHASPGAPNSPDYSGAYATGSFE